METDRLELLFLGTGTSTGVPMIGCTCETCGSGDVRDKRLRASILLRWISNGVKKNILIDTATDLRTQALGNGVNRVDAVIYTHPHADHVHGIDELRSFNFIQDAEIPCYGSQHTLERIKKMFDYIFGDVQTGGTKPHISLNEVENDFTLFGKDIIPLPVRHGNMDVYGYKVGPLAYITDASFIPDETLKKIENIPLLVIGAVRLTPHPTHFTVGEALEVSRRVGAGKTYFTHIGHQIKHDRLSADLPENIFLAYDGLTESLPF